MTDDEIRRIKLEAIRECIQSLRDLQSEDNHQRQWNHSGETNFAPVELSDYLINHVYYKTKGR